MCYNDIKRLSIKIMKLKNKQEILGQYFTKIEIVQRLLDLLFSYKKYEKEIKILEPSFGTGNFIKGLKEKNI